MSELSMEVLEKRTERQIIQLDAEDEAERIQQFNVNEIKKVQRYITRMNQLADDSVTPEDSVMFEHVLGHLDIELQVLLESV